VKNKMLTAESYLAGMAAYKANKKYADNPYTDGTTDYYWWINGFGDAGDKDFFKLVKVNPNILIDS
jgi:hypothetical protein